MRRDICALVLIRRQQQQPQHMYRPLPHHTGIYDDGYSFDLDDGW